MVKNFFVITYEFVMTLVFSLPRYRFCIFLKILLMRLMGAKFGKGVIIYPGVWITPARNLVVGDNVDIAKDVIITTSGGVFIGDRALIGYRTQILSANHKIPPIGEPIPVSGDDYAEVHIGTDSWIGANVIITPGVRVGNGAIVAAGSVVTKDIPDNAIAAGVPARVIRMRSD